jgi:hypothetical protein
VLCVGPWRHARHWGACCNPCPLISRCSALGHSALCWPMAACTSLGSMLHSLSLQESLRSVLAHGCSVLAHGGMYVTGEHAAFLVPSGVIALCVGPWVHGWLFVDSVCVCVGPSCSVGSPCSVLAHHALCGAIVHSGLNMLFFDPSRFVLACHA